SLLRKRTRRTLPLTLRSLSQAPQAAHTFRMKLLVIGSGGREHALVWKLAQSPRVEAIWCAPGNAGIASERLPNGQFVQCINLGVDDFHGLASFARDNSIGLTVVGPDNPLAAGIVDHFQAHGLRIWGPNRK